MISGLGQYLPLAPKAVPGALSLQLLTQPGFQEIVED
jgi:hypothetical protein